LAIFLSFLPSFLPSFPSALQLRVSFGLLNNLPPFFSIPRLTVWFLNHLVFTVLGCQPYAQTPTWRTRVSLFVWLLPLDLSGMADPTSSYATAGIALTVSGALKPHYDDKVETPSLGIFLSIAVEFDGINGIYAKFDTTEIKFNFKIQQFSRLPSTHCYRNPLGRFDDSTCRLIYLTSFVNVFIFCSSGRNLQKNVQREENVSFLQAYQTVLKYLLTCR
jgi:hypothetical protein